MQLYVEPRRRYRNKLVWSVLKAAIEMHLFAVLLLLLSFAVHAVVAPAPLAEVLLHAITTSYITALLCVMYDKAIS